MFLMPIQQIEFLSRIFFVIALIHTFLAGFIRNRIADLSKESRSYQLLHLFTETELVFGIWASVFVFFSILIVGKESFSAFKNLDFGEPYFVFVIMVVVSSPPIILFFRELLQKASAIFPLGKERSMYFACMTLGPLLGSFITEPAAMVITALILRDRYFRKEASERFKYATLGTLFVNVSIGGVLTPFAAPPVLMVASRWGWNTRFMLSHFGYKAILAVFINSILLVILERKEIDLMHFRPDAEPHRLTKSLFIQLLFLLGVVLSVHSPFILTGLLLAYFVFHYPLHYSLKFKEGLGVAFFLGGLVVLGKFQESWLTPCIQDLGAFSLFLVTSVLTAFTDNAALTYLGSQVPSLSEASRYALVAGAVAGGGMTVIANAPNPAGFAILQERFIRNSINPLKLAIAALVPTLVSMIFFWML